jgi:hypothetical protein
VVKEGRRKKYVNSKLVASDKEVDEKVQQQKITKIIPSTVNKSLSHPFFIFTVHPVIHVSMFEYYVMKFS